MTSLISCVTWVRKGVATQHPAKYQLDDDEIKRISTIARIEVEDMRKELEDAQAAVRTDGDNVDKDDDDEGEDQSDNQDEMDISEPNALPNDPEDLSAYMLDDYDKDSKTAGMGAFTNVGRLTYYQDEKDDPYVTLPDIHSDDEREELEVLPSDNLIVIAKTEDDVSQLEIYVYDESEENLYAHHDIMLPAFPLCLEWLDFRPYSTASSQNGTTSNPMGSFVAVGTFDPEIEIWSLDTIDQMYPDTILGRPDKTAQHIPVPLGTGKKKKKKTKHRQATSAHHVDAVLSLSWNRSHRNLLASASADRTVKLWDLSRDPLSEDGSGGAIRSFDVHKDKVQSVQWNSADPTVLLTGSYDRTVRVFDTRTPDVALGAIVGADVEQLRWDPFEPHAFYVSLENGLTVSFDARTLPSDLNKPCPARWTLHAHDGAVSSLDVNPHIKGCLVTGGTDKLVKVWNVTEDGENRQISLVTSRDLGISKVFSTQWSPDEPLTVAAAGSRGGLQIWDVSANAGVRKTFASKLKAHGKEIKEKTGAGVVTVQDDEDEDEEGDGWEDEE